MIDPEAMVQAIADGLTLAQTADRFGVSVDEVRDAQKQALAAFSDGDALRLDWMLESKRLAACGLRFYQIAMRGNDPQAAVIFIKASERRASLMGANAPAAASVKLMGSCAAFGVPCRVRRETENVYKWIPTLKRGAVSQRPLLSGARKRRSPRRRDERSAASKHSNKLAGSVVSSIVTGMNRPRSVLKNALLAKLSRHQMHQRLIVCLGASIHLSSIFSRKSVSPVRTAQLRTTAKAR